MNIDTLNFGLTSIQLGWSLPFGWAAIWTLITIPWVQSDLRREKAAWAENRGQGGIRWTDDVTAPTARTRFASVQESIPHILPWFRDKQEAPSIPSAECAEGVVQDLEAGPVGGSEGVVESSEHATNGADGTHEKDMGPESATH